MFEFLIGILVTIAVIYTGLEMLNRISTREPATDLDKWEADHIDILTSKMMGEWLGRRDKRTEEKIKAAINEKCRKECRVIELVEILAIIESFLGGYRE